MVRYETSSLGYAMLGKGYKFTSAILPPWLKRTPSLDALIPALYPRGISTGDFSEALQAIPVPRAKGVSASNVLRLKDGWKKDHAALEKRDLSNRRYAYWWADGICFNVRHNRQGKERCCIPVLMGVTGDGRKELIAVLDRERESKLAWLEVMRDLKKRGLLEGTWIAVGDGSLGYWAGSGGTEFGVQGTALLGSQDRQQSEQDAEDRIAGRQKTPQRSHHGAEKGRCEESA